ncbi:hypothetical protein JF729_18260 [Mycobacterium intracellulare]|uniref:hypothetical protein n=1 Tax=Mycobacterium intracellulare TaxID=1767 RepID=UPI001CD9FD6E|nr:hypothetical protein [Mycobacterium intracellulare]MCA2249723.1 hypothetical protein [Mycobacterium intracellulare]
MTVEPLLHAIDQLFGAAAETPSAAQGVRQVTTSAAAPANWQSPAAHDLVERQRTLQTSSQSFADTDDTLSNQLHSAAQTIRAGKTQIARIIDTYRINHARLASAPNNPETAALSTKLDRDSLAEALNTVRTTQDRLPTLVSHQPSPTPPTPASQQRPDTPTMPAQPAANQLTLQPPVGYIIWCSPSTMTSGFICEFLQSDGSIIWRHSPIDITGGMP